jgi:hypothetical protein
MLDEVFVFANAEEEFPRDHDSVADLGLLVVVVTHYQLVGIATQ